MKKINAVWLFIVGCIILVSSCQKDEYFDNIDIKNAKGFYIINEGLFTQGNASLSFYDFEKDAVTNDLFESVNNRPLGDVFQSMKFHQGKGYLVINNSSKIEVVDSASMQSIRTVEGFTSPRYIHFYKNKAYVTDLYSNEIHVLDAATMEKTGAIPVEGSTEDIVEANGKLLVAVNQSSAYTEESLQGLLVIDPEKDEIVKYVKLSEGAVDIEVDVVGNIWVYCTGFWGGDVPPGKLHKLKGSNYGIERTFDFGKLAYFGSPLKFNQAGNVLYFALAGDPANYTEFNIYSMPVNSTELPVNPVFSGKDRYVYGYQLDEVRNELYVLDATEGGQKGELVRVDAKTSEVKGTYEVGYFPSSIVFKY